MGDARAALARAAPEERARWAEALAALEARAAARGLSPPSERERLPTAVARRRLAGVLRAGPADRLLAFIPDLDARALFTIFRRAVGRLPADDRLRVLEAVFERLDDLHYEPAVARRRRQRWLREDLPLERRLERLEKAIAFQLRTLHGLRER